MIIFKPVTFPAAQHSHHIPQCVVQHPYIWILRSPRIFLPYFLVVQFARMNQRSLDLSNARASLHTIFFYKTFITFYRTPSGAIGMSLDGKDPERVPSTYCGTVIAPVSYPGSPSSALPPELLSLIFIYAKPKKRVAHKIPFEVALSHVCKFWRNVALGTPGLWNRIDIYSKRSKAWVSPYLERSCQRPLDVYVDIYRSDKAFPENLPPLIPFRSIIRKFSEHIHRLRLFSLICYRQGTAAYWEGIFKKQDAPILQSFSIKYGNDFGHVRSGFGNITTIFNGGSLDCLTFMETDTPNILPPPNLLNLTTLYLHGLDPSLSFSSDKFIEMFASLPSIVNLSLQGTVNFGFWPTGMPSTPEFTLSNLKSLRLLEGGGLAIRMLLAMSACHLESLWLDCSYDNFPIHLFDAPQFNIVGKPKFPNLKYLTIVMDNFTMSSRFAAIFPTITHLHYQYPNFKEATQLIQAFTAPRWSSLQVLVFSSFREKDAQQLNTALTRILLQRRQDGIPLSNIFLDKDHQRWLDCVVPDEAKKLYRLVTFDLLTVNNYPEYWWNTFERSHGKILAL